MNYVTRPGSGEAPMLRHELYGYLKNGNICITQVWGRGSYLYYVIYANLVILATPVRVIGHQVVCLGHLGGFVAFQISWI